MTATVLALLMSIVLGTGCLAWGYVGVGLPQLARWIGIFGVLWVIAAWRRWRWFAHVGLAFDFLAAAVGLWFLDFPPGWMFAGAIFGLIAWDLTYLRYRLRFSGSDEERRRVELRHLLYLSLIAILGFFLASLTMVVKLQFGFDWIVLLAIVLALGSSQIVRWFRNRA